MTYLIGTDIGTSGTKTILMDTQGHVLAQAIDEYDVLTPKPLWAEQWPEVWLTATKTTIKQVVAEAGVPADEIKGIGISGLYGGSGVPLDAQMQPVRPCLIWLDRRAQAEADWVKQHIDMTKLAMITGNEVVDPYYGFTKMLWIKQHEPENWQKTRLFLPPSNDVIYRLTGEVAIDHAAAGLIGGVYDVQTRDWSDELLAALGLSRDILPERIVDSTEIVGGLTDDVAHELGLQPGTPVISGGVDVGAANVGMGVFEPGRYVATIGSSMNAALVTETPITDQGMIVWPYQYRGTGLYYNFSGSATAGAIIKWFRDNFAQLEVAQQANGGVAAYPALDAQAAEIEPGSDGLVVLPYFMGERAPLWNADAKGVIFGLSLAHTRAHVYHAFEEAVCYALRESIERTGRDLGDSIVIAGGVTHSADWVQLFADVTGYAVQTPLINAEANLGDVILTGLATATLTVADVRSWQVLGEPVEPNLKRHAQYEPYYVLYKQLYADLMPDMTTLSRLVTRR